MDNNENLLDTLSNLEPPEQWRAIYHLIHERLGDDPQHGAALTDLDGQTYLFLVPPRLLEKSASIEVEHPSGSGVISSKKFLNALLNEKDHGKIAGRLSGLARDERSKRPPAL